MLHSGQLIIVRIIPVGIGVIILPIIMHGIRFQYSVIETISTSI